MAGSQERVLRRRIRSVQSTMKITRAFELIAASRIVRAQHAIAAARPYVAKMVEVVSHLADTPEAASLPLFGGTDGESTPESGRRSAVILIAADRGLAGAYNSSVIRAGERAVREQESAGREVMLIAVGRKAETYFRFRKRPLAASITGVTERPTFEDARQVVAAIAEPLATGELGQVQLVFTQFASMSSQSVTVRQLVPIDRDATVAAATERTEDSDTPGAPRDHAAGSKTVYEFESDPDEILERLLPRWLEAEILAAMLEAAASQQAARQRAMKAATDNADELIKVFRRDMNRARQESITTEIMEIVGGSEALRQGASDDQSGLYFESFEPAAESA